MEYQSEDNGYNVRITRLEATVAQLQGQVAGLSTHRAEDAVKGLSAAQQATQHLYAPLRSDVRALTELAVFVRDLAGTPLDAPFDKVEMLAALVHRARALLKDLT